MLVNGIRIQKGQPTPLSLKSPTGLQFLPSTKVFYFHDKPPKRANPVLGTVGDASKIYKLTTNINWPQPNSRRHSTGVKSRANSDEYDESEFESTQSTSYDEYTDKSVDTIESDDSCNEDYDDLCDEQGADSEVHSET